MPRDLSATRQFFGPRAAGWDEKFSDDGPVYARAVAELGPLTGAAVLDAGCGRARAAVPLRAAVGPDGLVMGVDATREMLATAAAAGRGEVAALVVGDAGRLPLPDGAVQAVFAAGLIPHVPDPLSSLAELARVTRPGGRLAIFHPIGRVALAARHGHEPGPDDILDPANIVPALAASGWEVLGIDDSDDRYLTLALRTDGR